MARLVGVDLPKNKKVLFALPYIYGIGRPMAKVILTKLGIDPDTRVHQLTEQEINKLREEIERNHLVEGDLRREVSNNIKRLMEINCFRGQRHKRGLPCRGQRTKTNAKTRRGRKGSPVKQPRRA